MEFTLVTIVKALAEVAGFALIGQGILYLFAGANRERNFAYQMLKAVTSPVFKTARFLTPRFVLDRHLWMLAVLLVFLVWYIAAQYKLGLCLTQYRDNPSCAEMLKTLEERRGATTQ
ncbi:MAG TPA: hypothetical protein VLC55_00840 [Burkholderiales bacterium]|nr:hypothetical protein [Burkholderiales bacterium]